jgi:hypothetical protein
MSFIDNFAQAIAIMEGFFKPNSLAARNNNPGNLRSWGKTPIAAGYAAFQSAEQGWNALRAQIQRNIDRGLTLREFFAGKPGVYSGYAPSADKNNPEAYARFVAGRLGVDVDTPLSQIVGPGLPRPKGNGQAPVSVWPTLISSERQGLSTLDTAALALLAVALVWLLLD